MMNSAVVVDDVHVRRGKRMVLDGLSVEIPHGAIVGLLGPSGCGKTTLMRAIVGVQIVRSGVVTVLGEPAGTRNLRKRVGYMTQQASVYDDLTVRQNLDYFRRVLHGQVSHVERVIERTKLSDAAGQLVGSLSGGQQRRVSLAVALLGDPELLVLDEPTVGLDPVLRADLWGLFRDLTGEGTTIVVSSHVMDEASRCDRLLLMRDGEIIADDSPEGLLRRTGASGTEDAFLKLIAEHGAERRR